MFWIWSALLGTAGGAGTARARPSCALADPETVRARTASVAATVEAPIGRARRRQGWRRVIRDAPFEKLRGDQHTIPDGTRLAKRARLPSGIAAGVTRRRRRPRPGRPRGRRR